MKIRWAAAASVALALLVCTACAQTQQAQQTQATVLTFSDTGVQASGATQGYTVSGTNVTITAAGSYRFEGEASEGTIAVEEDVQGVTLILSGLTLQSSSTAPVVCGKDSQVTLEVAQGTQNTLTNQEDATNADAEGAAVKVKSGASLLLTGSGVLNCEGLCKNGIKGAAQTTLTVSGPTLTIDSVTNSLAVDGKIQIDSGTLTIRSGEDGIAAGEELAISGGTFDIQTGQGHEELADDTISAKCLKSDALLSVTGGTFALDSAEDTIHASQVQLEAGSFTLAAADDAIHADYALTVGTAGGEGPDIRISTSYEGLEDSQVYLNGGTVALYATDDGINAAGDDAGDTGFLIEITGGSYQVDADGDGLDSNGSITMTDGTMLVYGAPNGANSALDYETACNCEGGILLAVGTANMAQLPTGLCVVFGEEAGMGRGGRAGQDVPAGGFNMTQTPPEAPQGEAPQGQMPERPAQQDMEESDDVPRGGAQMEEISNALLQEGTAFSVQDASGNVVFEGEGVKQANHIILACAQLVEGQTYSLVVNGQAVATAQAQQAQGTGGVGGAGIPAPA